MADKIKVTVLKQKVFHDGRSMIVLKPGKGELEERHILRFVREKVISAPEGWRDPLDHDGDGAPGGSEPYEPPVLTGKNKAELLAIAADEEVTIPDGATNAEIVKLIEDARDAYDDGEAPAA